MNTIFGFPVNEDDTMPNNINLKLGDLSAYTERESDSEMIGKIDDLVSFCFFRLTIENIYANRVHAVYIDSGADYDDSWKYIGEVASRYEKEHDGYLVRSIEYMGYITRVEK